MRKLASALLAFASLASAAPAVKTGSVLAPDGVRIVYDERGQGATALVFVHCWSCDRSFWREQADVFADRYRVVTLDLAGHGESGKDRKTWTILGLAGDVRAVVEKLNLKKVILIGHSMGGPVALEAARLLHGRVVGVVPVDTLHNAEQQFPAQLIDQMAGALEADYPGTIEKFMGSMLPKDADPTVRDFVLGKSKAAYRPAVLALMRDFANLDFKKLFAGAGVPIRAINAKPPLSQPTQIESNRKYADFDAVLIEGVGHFLQLERPKEFNDDLAKFAAALAK